MLAVGLTGGIGAGKSTVADLLVGHGAVLVDADRVAREVVGTGRTGLPAAHRPLRSGGSSTATASSTGPALAALVFGHPEALADLNAITHPAIGVEMIARKDSFAGTDEHRGHGHPPAQERPPRDCCRWPR